MCSPLSLHIRQVINLFICETFVLSPQVLPYTKSESGNTGTPVFREIRFTEPRPKGTLNFVLSSVSMLYDIQYGTDVPYVAIQTEAWKTLLKQHL